MTFINHIKQTHYVHYITLHYIALHCIAALHCTALHCNTLHYLALHSIALHYITYIHMMSRIYALINGQILYPR